VHYAEPSKSFLDALTARGRDAVGTPGAADALAAHHLVDLAYASARAGGAPIGVGHAEQPK
jgi:hypothetical protein